MRDPFLRFMKRLIEIHDDNSDVCPSCRVPVPCDTMRAAWIYDLERGAS